MQIGDSPSGSSPNRFVESNGLVFFVATTTGFVRNLYVTDGTLEGTHLVVDVHPGALGSSIDHLTAADNALYFAANDGTTGLELHRLATPIFEDGFESGDTAAWN